jgi:hypothetical protein
MESQFDAKLFCFGHPYHREGISYLHISSAGDPFNTIPYRHVYLVHRLSGVLQGQVDQLEDRYLGMVEASGSNPDLSISFFCFCLWDQFGHAKLFCQKRSRDYADA